MVRKVRFQTIYRPIGAGNDTAAGLTNGMSVSYTSRSHSDGGGLFIEAPNIEITVPDNWGGSTLSMAQQANVPDADSPRASYLTPLGEPITMNIVIKAHGNIDTYYQLRDRFTRTWGVGLFTVNIKTGDYHGGNQFIDGYFSSIAFDEFRTQNDVSGTAVFTPTTPWYFQYGGYADRLPFGDCPVLGGKPTIDSEGYAMINTNFVSFRRIYPQNTGSPLGIKIVSADYSDPLHIVTTHILPEDIFQEGIAKSCSLIDSCLTTYDDNGQVIDNFDLLPAGMLAFGLNPNTKVKLFHYAEKYGVPDAFPNYPVPPIEPDDGKY